MRSDGQFMPPSDAGHDHLPRLRRRRASGAARRSTPDGVLYVNANEMPWILTMVPTDRREGASSGAAIYAQHCAACHGVDRKGDRRRRPCRRSTRLDSGSKTRATWSRSSRTGKGVMPSFAFLRRAAAADGDRPTCSASADDPAHAEPGGGRRRRHDSLHAPPATTAGSIPTATRRSSRRGARSTPSTSTPARSAGACRSASFRS